MTDTEKIAKLESLAEELYNALGFLLEECDTNFIFAAEEESEQDAMKQGYSACAKYNNHIEQKEN